MYNGAPREDPDEKTLRQFGAYPDVASSYYQPTQAVNVPFESARIERGTSPNITMTTKGTQYLAGIADRDPTALAWLDRYVAGLRAIASVDPRTPVYATLDHEYRGKVRRGEITGGSADPAVYGEALSVLYRKARAAAPNIETSYWMVGYHRAFEGAVGEAFTTLPTTIMFDPYADAPNDTIASITFADMAWIKAQPWYVGQPIALAEFGMPVEFGDAAMAEFFTDVRPQLDALGIEWATFFNRSKNLDTKITTGDYPEAVAAFTRSYAAGRDGQGR